MACCLCPIEIPRAPSPPSQPSHPQKTQSSSNPSPPHSLAGILGVQQGKLSRLPLVRPRRGGPSLGSRKNCLRMLSGSRYQLPKDKLTALTGQRHSVSSDECYTRAAWPGTHSGSQSTTVCLRQDRVKATPRPIAQLLWNSRRLNTKTHSSSNPSPPHSLAGIMGVQQGKLSRLPLVRPRRGGHP